MLTGLSLHKEFTLFGGFRPHEQGMNQEESGPYVQFGYGDMDRGMIATMSTTHLIPHDSLRDWSAWHCAHPCRFMWLGFWTVHMCLVGSSLAQEGVLNAGQEEASPRICLDGFSTMIFLTVCRTSQQISVRLNNSIKRPMIVGVTARGDKPIVRNPPEPV